MNWTKVGEEHAANHARQLIFIGLPSMVTLVIVGAMLYAGVSGTLKLLGF